MSDLATCVECGHLHYDGATGEYVPCPVCDCEGQTDDDDEPIAVMFPASAALAKVAERVRRP